MGAASVAPSPAGFNDATASLAWITIRSASLFPSPCWFFFVRIRKVICYPLVTACNSLKDTGVGLMDPSRLRAATGGAKGNWERSLYLRNT